MSELRWGELRLGHGVWKVSFNIASEASYVYILNRQKLIKNAKNGQIVLPDMSVLIGQKLVENAKIKKFHCDILSNFQTMCEQSELLHQNMWA